jgi:hypothetical protein
MRMNENGILSVDFLAGFSIFLIAMILVINYIPGILIGINSAAIDYDAVAYRSGVILVEDPGSPALPFQKEPWEQKGKAFRSEMNRLGLAVSSETPNILSRKKIEIFFNESFFDSNDYEYKVLFADIPYAPYAYNISLKIDGEDSLSIGSTLPDRSYGYMRRLVKVKEYTSADIDVTDVTYFNTGSIDGTVSNITRQSVYVELNYSVLLDASINDAYRIDPRSDPVNFTMFNFDPALNWTDIENVTLNGVGFFIGQEGELDNVTDLYVGLENETYQFTVDGVPHTIVDSVILTSTSVLEMELNPPLPFAGETQVFMMDFNMTYDFQDFAIPHWYIDGTYWYDYDSVTQPALTPGVLEVVIW